MDHFPRSRRLIRLACLLPLTAAGCRTATPGHSIWDKPPARHSQATAQPTAPAEGQMPARPPLNLSSNNAGKTTDFHEKATQGQSFNVHVELGRNKEKLGDYEGASAEFQKALDSCGHYTGLLAGVANGNQKALAHRKIAGALDHLGRFEQAEEHYRAASKAAPNDPKVWNDLGYSYYLQGRHEYAAQCLRHAAKLAPNEPQIQTNLGFVLAASGQTDAALKHLSQAGGGAVGHANLGFILAALGKPDEAREHYRKALELQPQLALARQAVAKLDAPAVPTQPAPTAVAEATPPSRDANVSPTALPPAPEAEDTTSQGIPWEK